MDAVLHKALGLFEELGGEEHDRGGAVADFVVLRHGDIDQSARRGVDDVEQVDDGAAIVGDGHSAAILIVDQFITSAWAQRRADDLGDRLARVDVVHHVGGALGLLAAVFQQNHRGL